MDIFFCVDSTVSFMRMCVCVCAWYEKSFEIYRAYSQVIHIWFMEYKSKLHLKR